MGFEPGSYGSVEQNVNHYAVTTHEMYTVQNEQIKSNTKCECKENIIWNFI